MSINSTTEFIRHCQDLKKYLHLNLKESAILTRNLIIIIYLQFLQFLSPKLDLKKKKKSEHPLDLFTILREMSYQPNNNHIHYF